MEVFRELRKSGQFSVRTYVRKMRQNLRKMRGMSGDLDLYDQGMILTLSVPLIFLPSDVAPSRMASLLVELS